jgi:hypothetical protein
MAIKTYYFKDAVPTGATLHRSLQDGGTAPTAATTTTGWVTGTNAAGQSALQNGGTELSRTSNLWSATLQPSAAPSQTLGDCWRSENTINGVFANTNWTFAFGVRSVTAAHTGRFRLAVRVWRSSNANGTSAVELTGGRVTSSITAANLSTTVDTAVSITWTPGATKSLSNEYLFVQVGVEITTAGGGNTQDIDFRVASTYAVTTPDFQVAVSGAFAATESGNDTFASSGQVIVNGSLVSSEVGNDTFTSSGQVVVSGSLSTSEVGVDSFSANGTVLVQGSLSATEDGLDTFSATGTVSSQVISGSLSTTEVGNDAFESSGLVLIYGSLAANEVGDDTFSANGSDQNVVPIISVGGISRSKILEAAKRILDLLDKDTVKQTEQIKKVKARLKKVKKPEDLEDLQPIVNAAIVEVQKQKKLADDIAHLNFVINELKLIKNQLNDEEEALLMLMA